MLYSLLNTWHPSKMSRIDLSQHFKMLRNNAFGGNKDEFDILFVALHTLLDNESRPELEEFVRIRDCFLGGQATKTETYDALVAYRTVTAPRIKKWLAQAVCEP